MAEEVDLLELFNETAETKQRNNSLDDGIFVSTAIIGLLAHVLLIYVIGRVKRLQTRTNCVIMHWIIFEAATHNLLYPLLHFWRVHEFSFALHLVLGDVLLATFCCTLLLMHVLLNDSLMTAPTDATFHRSIERLYALLVAAVVFMLFWKTLTFHQLYIEIVLVVAGCVAAILLVVRVLWRQCTRLLSGCRPLSSSSGDLRLHIATVFVLAKVLTVGANIASLKYRHNVLLVHLSRVWCLSGVYVLALLAAKDVAFRIGVREAFGCRTPHTVDADIDHIISDLSAKDECETRATP